MVIQEPQGVVLAGVVVLVAKQPSCNCQAGDPWCPCRHPAAKLLPKEAAAGKQLMHMISVAFTVFLHWTAHWYAFHLLQQALPVLLHGVQ